MKFYIIHTLMRGAAANMGVNLAPKNYRRVKVYHQLIAQRVPPHFASLESHQETNFHHLRGRVLKSNFLNTRVDKRN